MELMDVMLGVFAGTGPDEGPSFFVDLEHMAFGFRVRVAEHAHEHHRHVAHEVDGIIVDDDVPLRGEVLFRLGLVDLDDAGLAGFPRLSHTVSNISDRFPFTNFGLIWEEKQ